MNLVMTPNPTTKSNAKQLSNVHNQQIYTLASTSSNPIMAASSTITKLTSTNPGAQQPPPNQVVDSLIEYLKITNKEYTEQQLRQIFYKFYEVGSQIGNGGFGTIFSGIRIKDNTPVAFKVIKKSKILQWYNVSNPSFYLDLLNRCFRDFVCQTFKKKKNFFQNCLKLIKNYF